MNPPFTNRAKMGEKFPKDVQQELRSRVDSLEQCLVNNDSEMNDFVDKNSIRPLFVALADSCMASTSRTNVLTMICPTIVLSATSGQQERRILAHRYHIHTIVTCHQPGNVNLSQNTNINESIVVTARRHNGSNPPTRFIQLDKMPLDDSEVEDLHRCLLKIDEGQIENGWGEVSYWPADLIEEGDWTAAIWRSSHLAKAAAQLAGHPDLRAIHKHSGLSVWKTGATLSGPFERSDDSIPGSFPVLYSKGAAAQTKILGRPDEHWIPKQRNEEILRLNSGIYPEVQKLLQKGACPLNCVSGVIVQWALCPRRV